MRKNPLRISLVVLIILLLIGGGAGVYWYLHQSNGNAQDSGNTQAISIYPDVIPASTAPFKAYSNTEAYRFTVSYPSDWLTSTNQNGTAFTIAFDYQVQAGPDDYPLEIDCDANPSKLTAQQWSEAQPQLTSQAPQKLASGIEAFVATGTGEGAYTAYTAVQNQQVCTLYAFNASPENSTLITKAINTFTWSA